MKASWEKIENNQVVLHVEVDEEKVAEALDRAFKKVVKQINVPGFRKGKVPRRIFEARFGVESLYQDALDILLPEAYMEAVKETKIEPIDRPEVDFDEFAKGKPFKFTAKVQVKPEVKLGEYKGIEIPEKDLTVTPEEVEEELKLMQQRYAELIVVEEGNAENGDLTIIDFEGKIDGEPFEGGKAEKYSLELGSGSFIPGFEDQIVGMAKGEEKDIEVTFPEDYHVSDLAGKKAVFHIKLHEIKRKKLPVLDDEFAKDVSEFETLEEYKEEIKKRIAHRKEHEHEHFRENTVVEKAAAASTVDIPEVMIETEIEHMMQDFINRLRLQGMNLETYFKLSGQNEESLKEQMKPDAEKRVRNHLVLEAIAKAENVTATEEEINEELEKMSKIYRKSVDELRTMFTENGSMEGLEKDIIIRKTIKFLIEHSKSTPEVA